MRKDKKDGEDWCDTKSYVLSLFDTTTTSNS